MPAQKGAHARREGRTLAILAAAAGGGKLIPASPAKFAVVRRYFEGDNRRRITPFPIARRETDMKSPRRIVHRKSHVAVLLLLIAASDMFDHQPASAAEAAAPASKPNIILIMADDFGFECVAANGGESYKTPNLDRLAAEGVRFEQCFVQPLCTPTRVQLMTGLYNVRNYINFGTLPRTAQTFGHLLKQAGYATGICGKWQLGHEPDAPQHFGFDEAYLWQHTRRPPRYANAGLERNGKAEDFHAGEYGPDLINDFALDFVTRHRDEKFFLYYPLMLTHDPFQPTPDSPDWDPKTTGENAKRNVRHFGEMTTYMDKLIGKLTARLDELKIRDNTLLLFVGDNGTSPAVTSQFRGAAYRGGKGTANAAGMHVPLIASWPGHAAKGKVCGDLIGSVDFLPTICEAAGVKLPAPTDGVSFYGQLRGETGTPRTSLYCWYARDGAAVQAEFAMSTRYKLYKDGRFLDLQADPLEQRARQVKELAGEEAAAAKVLQATLDEYADARPTELKQQAKSGTKPAQQKKRKAKKSPAPASAP
ncbi:MAG: arylsulfatase [Pirellula sp.]|nr:arylsulfatase [Pirellula sp.]